MRIPGQDVRNVDESGRPTLNEHVWKKSVQRFIRNAADFIATGMVTVGSPDGGDLGPGTINAEEIYDSGNRVLTEAAGQTITAGFDSEPKDHGTVSSGTLTIDPVDGQHHIATFNGALTLSPASTTKHTTAILHITNGASAGTVTFSGFTRKYPSGSLNTTSGNKFTVFFYFYGADGADYAIQARQ